MSTPTPEQARAVAARGQVLVSASAGSGKTHVMIERACALLGEGADVREMLAVTFTNKAAAQMRERLRAALAARAARAEGAEKRNFKAQLAELPLADVCTIHAFCGRLVRTYFYLVDIDPAFRIVSPDDAEGRALKGRALDECFERGYREGDEGFAHLVALYFRKKRDDKLRSLVLSVHAKARELADYRTVLGGIASRDDFDRAASYLYETECRRARSLLKRAEALSERLEAVAPAGTKVAGQLVAALQAFLGAGDLFAARGAAAGEISRCPSATKATGEAYDALEALKRLSADVKKAIRAPAAFGEREEEYANYLGARETAAAFARLVLDFDARYSELKREAGVADYGDLEHFALAVLSDGAACAAVRARYRHIFVDEYQDVNPTQAAIFSLLAGEDTDVFLVGDGKQAIYGFRGSRSEYFARKREEYENLGLTRNFRTAPAVLGVVNDVFSAMDADYEPMCGGEDYPAEAEAGVTLHRPAETVREKRERGVYSVTEHTGERDADPVAERVVRLVGEELGKMWYDAKEPDPARRLKPVRFGDIAVLVRRRAGVAGEIARALAERGIPVTSSASVDVCSFFEAKLVLDWLSYLDNAEQDVPMASAMLSAIGGFDESELARVRLAFRDGDFRTACRAYAKGGDALAAKLKGFFARTEAYRRAAAVKSASEMIGLLLSDGLEAQIAAKGDGRARLMRVRRLLAESAGAGDTHAFLRRIKDCGGKLEYAESGGEDAVKVLTMHAAKGLEYPVVILAELDTAFRGADRDEMEWTDEFLLAPKSFDEAARTCRETILRHAAAAYAWRDTLSGEKNLLYVAMTRAKCRLHLVLTDTAGEYDPEAARKLSDFLPVGKMTALFADETALPPPLPRAMPVYRAEEPVVQAVLAAGKEYAFPESTRLPVKSSATALVEASFRPAVYRDGEAEETDDADGTDGAHSAEEGTAYHAFLENVRFGRDAGEELARMREENVLPEEQLALLDGDRLRRILAMPCLASLAGKETAREKKFLVSFPAREVTDTDADDEIVFQGAIDLLVREDDGYTIVDYKDSALDDASLKARYAPQLKLYRKAVGKITGTKHVRAFILNIARCREIEM